MDRTEVALVRERPSAAPADGAAMLRIKLRADVWLGTGHWDCSMIAWQHPSSLLVMNTIWQAYDELHIGMAPLDICTRVCEALQVTPDPFP